MQKILMRRLRWRLIFADSKKEGVYIKTLVEFFDDNQLNNIVAALHFKPRKIIYVGYDAVMSHGKKENIERFFAMKGMTVQLEYCYVERYSFDDITEKLEKIIRTEQECFFDLTGGKELTLAAMGYVSAVHNLPMVQFNVRTGRLIKVKNCNFIKEPEKATVNIRESIVLGGGVVLDNEPGEVHWDFNPEFCRDIKTMWNICRKRCSLWNKQSNVFHGFEQWGYVDDLWVRVDFEYLPGNGMSIMLSPDIIEPLCKEGLILNYKETGRGVEFCYKNRQIKKCMSKAGNILELYGYIVARDISAEEPGYFDDADIGVHIDWDGDSGSGRSVKNEVDLMLIRDLVPVFVSCKNGEIHKEALYELATVAEEFGGGYAKKILFATYISKDSESRKFFLQRAAEMNIKVIEDVDKMTHTEVMQELKMKTL